MLKDLFSEGVDITALVNEEVTRERGALDAAIDEGWIRVHDTPLELVAHYQESFKNMDAGESASIILARDWQATFLSDDGAGKAFARSQADIPRVLDTLDLLLEMESAGIIAKAEILPLVEEMEVKADFVYSPKRYTEFTARYKDL